MNTTHVAILPERLVLRRNVPLRLAGLGYAAITLFWLLATIGHVEGAAAGEALFLLMTLTGLVLASYRDDLIIDPAKNQIEVVRGFPLLLLNRATYALNEFDRLVIQEGAKEEFEESAIRPQHRAHFSVALASGQNHFVTLWSGDAEDSEAGRNKLRATAAEKSSRLSTVLGLPQG